MDATKAYCCCTPGEHEEGDPALVFVNGIVIMDNVFGLDVHLDGASSESNLMVLQTVHMQSGIP